MRKGCAQASTRRVINCGVLEQKMSEYQYYEFRAIDRPLSESDQAELEELSSRAEVTSTSFTNVYNYGDFKGDPRKLMERWFDLHLYVANWGTRRLMIRIPKGCLNPSQLEVFLHAVDWVETWESGENLIVDIRLYEDGGFNDWVDGEGLLGALAPLRTELLTGDLRMFYLLWLTEVEWNDIDDDEQEPLPGIGPLSGSHEVFADFFLLEPDLVRAAAERPLDADSEAISDGAVREAITAIPEAEKTELLERIVEGDPHVAVELRRKIRETVTPEAGEPSESRRTVAELRARAEAIKKERETKVAHRS